MADPGGANSGSNNPNNNSPNTRPPQRNMFRGARSNDAIPEHIHNEASAPHAKPRLYIHRPIDTEVIDQARRDYSTIDLLRMTTWEDVRNFGYKPCYREAYLPGIATGTTLGAVRFWAGASVFRACNWAVASWFVVTFGAFELCQWQRRREKDNIRRAIAVLDERKAMKEKEDAVSGAGAQTGAQSAGANEKGFWSSLKFW